MYFYLLFFYITINSHFKNDSISVSMLVTKKDCKVAIGQFQEISFMDDVMSKYETNNAVALR